VLDAHISKAETLCDFDHTDDDARDEALL